MEHIEKTLDVNVPVSVAYNQWTQFEEFPEFMEGVEEVKQLSDTQLHWRANIGGKDTGWDVTIIDQIPDYRIAWRSTSGTPNSGAITFHTKDDDTTTILLELSYEPEGMVENVGDMLGLVERRVEGDLQRFKDFIESHGHETGAWRGRIRSGRSEQPGDTYPS
jgi:uncharacterized membrane protein